MTYVAAASEEEVVEEEGSHGQWQCSRCTFVNSALLPACEMCDARAVQPPRTTPPSSKRKAKTGSSRGKRAKPPPQIGGGLGAYGFVRKGSDE